VRRWTRWGVALFLPALWLACGDDTDVANDDGGGAGGNTPPPADKVDLMADTNRDGVVDTFDNEGEELWTVEKGAAFLPNLDDDDGDGVRDSENDWVDFTEGVGPIDLDDMALMRIAPFADAPAGAQGRLFIDPMSLPHVRVFKLALDGNWYMVLGIDGNGGVLGQHDLNPDEVKAGLELRVEGRTLAGLHTAVSFDPNLNANVPWSGVTTFTYGVWETFDAPGPMIVDESNPDGVDELQMRVAPWLMFGNLTPHLDLLFAGNFGNSNQHFRDQIQLATDEDPMGSEFWQISGWSDQWTEDWMQTGFASIPGPNGTVHGIRLAMPRPWSQAAQLPVEWLKNNLTYQDSGYFVVYKTAPSGDSYDSHGNHDLVPPYEHNGMSYPYGRIVYGSGVQQETKAFYEAQLVQAPALTAKTSWLIVGHIDEVFSYVPANTPRGWKLLVGSPSLAKSMLEDLQAAGHGEVQMFVGKNWTNGPAAISINEVLGDPDLMSWSQQAQAETDGMLATYVAEIGLQPDEIIEIPFLYERDFGAMVAYNPGTVNSLVFNNAIVFPKPFGPMINGVDPFEADLFDRFATGALGLGRDGNGMQVYFADNWDLYHRLLGEVHCGTNISGPPSPEIKWWEAAQ
jgi:protein-arginine deiminase